MSLPVEFCTSGIGRSWALMQGQRGVYHGILDVRHNSGAGGVRLDVSDTGTGNAKIHTLSYESTASRKGLGRAAERDVNMRPDLK